VGDAGGGFIPDPAAAAALAGPRCNMARVRDFRVAIQRRVRHEGRSKRCDETTDGPIHLHGTAHWDVLRTPRPAQCAHCTLTAVHYVQSCCRILCPCSRLVNPPPG
jgi:hypothetical protein